jgi:hypothetical protein
VSHMVKCTCAALSTLVPEPDYHSGAWDSRKPGKVVPCVSMRTSPLYNRVQRPQPVAPLLRARLLHPMPDQQNAHDDKRAGRGSGPSSLGPHPQQSCPMTGRGMATYS